VALDILVSHPGNPRIYAVVAALARAGFQVRFATGYFYDPNGVEAALLHLLPPRLRARAERSLRRRWHEGIDRSIVDRSWFAEAVARLVKLIVPPRWRDLAANAAFDARGARLARRWRPRAVLAADGCARDTFAAARSIGIARVLDQVTGFLGEAARLYAEEAALRPDVAPALRLPAAANVRRCRDEALAADRVLAPSAYVRDTLVGIGVDPARIALLPFGVDVARFAPRRESRDGPFRVLYVGRISPAKGVHYLLDAFRAAAFPGAELVLVGAVFDEGGWLAPYRGLYRHVDFVPHGEIDALFRDADIYVYPSLHEGSSASILEAMASGLPVIATHNSGSLIADGQEGYLVPIRDAAMLADRMKTLHADPALRACMGAAARATAEAHDWRRYERELAAIVNALAGPR
jgi:starch synthase